MKREEKREVNVIWLLFFAKTPMKWAFFDIFAYLLWQFSDVGTGVVVHVELILHEVIEPMSWSRGIYRERHLGELLEI